MNKPLRWGILGTASIGETMIPALASSRNGVVRAIAGRSAEKAARACAAHGVALAYDSYEALLAGGEVDAVYLPLPNSLHATWTLRALDAGLHVLCEKPLAVSAVEARRVEARAAASGRTVLEGFMYRFHPLYDVLRERLRDAVGEIVALHAVFTFLLDDPGSIVARADLGGGALLDVGCYCVNVARLLLGREPHRVAAQARFEDGVDRTMTGTMSFPGGAQTTFLAGIDCAERQRVEITGERGTVVLENPWHPGLTEAAYRLERHGQPPEATRTPGGNAYKLMAEHFADVCAGRAPARWTVQDATANMAALDALRLSAQENRVVQIGPNGDVR